MLDYPFLISTIKKVSINILLIVINLVFTFYILANVLITSKDTGRYFASGLIFFFLIFLQLIILFIKLIKNFNKGTEIYKRLIILLVMITITLYLLYLNSHLNTVHFTILDNWLHE